jgi:hypothetical protein
LAALAMVTLLVAVPSGPAAAGADGAVGWPLGETPESGLPAGMDWVRNNPMLITALIPSMGAPPVPVADAYFEDFGSTAVQLWMDGSAEVASWQLARPEAPFVTWIDRDGTSLTWNGIEFESSGDVLGGLEADLPGRIGYQVGDEPLTVEILQEIEAGIAAVRTADPGALAFTNFSYHVPDLAGMLDYFVARVDADVVMMSDYFLNDLHYGVLEAFRDVGLRKGVPYWQYLNAYSGLESGLAPVHTESDLRWEAMAGLTYGYTGHAWFFYQAAAEGHPTATAWGGSVLHDGVGEWTAPRTGQWDDVAGINEELANLGRVVTQLTSTDVRLVIAEDARVTQPLGTSPWTPGAGDDPYLSGVRAADGELPMDILVGFFRDAVGEPYVMLQNARHTHSLGVSEDPLPGADLPGRIRLDFEFTDAPMTVDRTRVEVLRSDDPTIAVLDLDVVPPDPIPPPDPIGPDPDAPEPEVPEPPQERSTVEVTLDAGAALVFKYTDTIPFRLGPSVDGVGLVDPGTGQWYLREPAGVTSFYYGDPGDVPFLGDWDCDGVDTPGLYRRSDGFVYLRNANTQGVADIRFFFGNPGDLPLPGDFNGDGCDTVSIYRPSEARTFIINELGANEGGLGEAELDYVFGNPGDVPFVGDFDGDGIDTVGLHRESTGFAYFRNSHTQGIADKEFFYGDPGDQIRAGDWTGDGMDTVGLFRSDEARFYLKFANEQGPADIDFLFGEPGWIPVRGRFAAG